VKRNPSTTLLSYFRQQALPIILLKDSIVGPHVVHVTAGKSTKFARNTCQNFVHFQRLMERELASQEFKYTETKPFTNHTELILFAVLIDSK
jgi:hypothetical protein